MSGTDEPADPHVRAGRATAGRTRPPRRCRGRSGTVDGQHVRRDRSSPSSCALVVGAILIVLSDTGASAQLGYFFPRPSDTFSARLARGLDGVLAICSRARSSTRPTLQRRRRRSSGRSPRRSTYAAPLILGGLVGRRGVPRRPVQHRRPGPDHRRRRSAPATSASPGTCRRRPPHRRARSPASSAARCWGGIAGCAQGPHRRPRGHRDDHAQLHRALPARLPAHARTASRRRRRTTAQISRADPTSTPLLPHLFGAEPATDLGLHPRARRDGRAAGGCSAARRSASAAGGRREPVRGPHRRHERRAAATSSVMVIAGALVGLAGAPRCSGANDPALTADIDAEHRLRRDHGGAARPRPAVGHRRAPALLFGAFEAGGSAMQTHDQHPERHRHRHPGRDRALHRRAAAGPGDLPAARPARDRPPPLRRGGTA